MIVNQLTPHDQRQMMLHELGKCKKKSCFKCKENGFVGKVNKKRKTAKVKSFQSRKNKKKKPKLNEYSFGQCFICGMKRAKLLKMKLKSQFTGDLVCVPDENDFDKCSLKYALYINSKNI